MKCNIFCKRIRDLRLSKGYTQKFVALVMGVSKQQYWYMEKGNFTFNYDNVLDLCQLYKVDANYLFGITKKTIYPVEGVVQNDNDNLFTISE